MAPVRIESSKDLGRALKRYSFQWEFLESFVGGRSLIDVPLGAGGFHLRDRDEADHFVRNYGFDLSNPIEAAEALGNFHEALAFIRRYFLQPGNPDGLKYEIPRKIQEIMDVRDLLLMVGMAYPGQTTDSAGFSLRDCACSVLKVMHVIAHVDKDVRAPYFSEIQKQILDRFYRAIHRDESGQLYMGTTGGSPETDLARRIDLVAFETKPKKSRDSVLLKLLHKPESVAEELFDRVGIRFITKNCLDVLRVVQFLNDERIVMAPNLKPSRSRNSLIHLTRFKAEYPLLFEKLKQGQMAELEFVQALERALKLEDEPRSDSAENPYSSGFYRSVQFTSRQLVKISNPLHDDLRELKALAKGGALAAEVTKVMDRIDLKFVQKEVRFFYPFEVQIVDEKSHQENEAGRSAHSEYKRQQVLAALKRVMGSLA